MRNASPAVPGGQDERERQSGLYLLVVLDGGMNWQDKRVFVTGATGLVGQWLTRTLLDKGANPVLLVRDGVPAMWEFSHTCNIIRGDVTDQALMERILNEYDVRSSSTWRR